MEKRNKHWRIVQRNKVYAAKMRLLAAYEKYYILDDEWVYNPRWIDLYNANWCSVYKSVRTPCSCMMCRGERYDRRKFKADTKRELDMEGL